MPLCRIDSMTARFISRTSSKTTQKQRYPIIEWEPLSPDVTRLANKKCAKGLPLSSASNILRVQGAEKQASSMCRMSGSASAVAGSITHSPCSPSRIVTTRSSLVLAPPADSPTEPVPPPHEPSFSSRRAPDGVPPARCRRIPHTSIPLRCAVHRAG